MPFPKRFVTLCDQTTNCKPMDKGTTNSGLPVFGEIIKLLDKQRINTLADKMKANRYTKRLDAYQHLVIMLYAQLGQFESLRDIELGFLCAASRMNHFGMDYMVRRSTLSDANARRSPAFLGVHRQRHLLRHQGEEENQGKGYGNERHTRRLPESSRRTMAQDYPKPKPQGRYFATAGALPTKRGAQF